MSGSCPTLFDWTAGPAARHSGAVHFLLGLLCGWLTGIPAWADAVQSVRVRGNGVELRLAAPVSEMRAMLLAPVERIAMELRGAPRAAGEGASDDGLRLVFDLSRPAILSEGGFGPAGRMLAFQFRNVDDAAFARATAEGRMRFLPPFSFLRSKAHHGYSVSIPIPARLPVTALPHVYGDAGRPLVVIDAGHGGHDPGAISPDGALQEKDLTLQTALAIKDALLASGRVRVALTREDDRFLVLQERYGIARRLKADLFISVHCDSASDADAAGATIYTLSEVASDKEAARLAARENKADVIAGVDLGSQNADISSILIDLTQRETMNMSAGFAKLLGREAEPLIPIKPNFHRMASLMVLKAPDMPSVLFETGYISNPKDAEFLASEEGRKKVAESVRKAVEIHFATRLAAR